MIMIAGLPYYLWQNRSGRVTPVSRKDHFIRIRQAKHNKHQIRKVYDYTVGASVWYELHVPVRIQRHRSQRILKAPSRIRMVGEPLDMAAVVAHIDPDRNEDINLIQSYERAARVWQCERCHRFVNGDGKGHKPDCVNPQPQPPRPEVNPDGSLIVYPPLDRQTQVVLP